MFPMIGAKLEKPKFHKMSDYFLAKNISAIFPQTIFLQFFHKQYFYNFSTNNISRISSDFFIKCSGNMILI